MHKVIQLFSDDNISDRQSELHERFLMQVIEYVNQANELSKALSDLRCALSSNHEGVIKDLQEFVSASDARTEALNTATTLKIQADIERTYPAFGEARRTFNIRPINVGHANSRSVP